MAGEKIPKQLGIYTVVTIRKNAGLGVANVIAGICPEFKHLFLEITKSS